MLAASPTRPIPPTFTPINADIDDRRQENETKVHIFCQKNGSQVLFCQSQAKSQNAKKKKKNTIAKLCNQIEKSLVGFSLSLNNVESLGKIFSAAAT